MRSLVLILAMVSSASAAPRRLTYRYLHVGRALGQYDVTTYSLELDGTNAKLGVERALTDPKQRRPDQTGPYLPEKPEVHPGSAAVTKNGIDLALDQPFEHLSCTWKTMNIASADAVRIKSPGYDGECGDRGVFSPAKTTRMKVLACGPDDQFVFGEAPGIERAGLSEECFIQGAGLRAIGADHAIRRVSPKL